MLTLPSGNLMCEWIDELPHLSGSRELYMDFETRSGDPSRGGIRPYHGDRICGIAVTADDHERAWYIPIRHNGISQHRNLPIGPVQEWLRDVLQTSRDWVNHNVKFDAHFAAVDGAIFGGRLVDTLTLSKIYYSDSMTYGLKHLCRNWVGLEMSESTKIKAYLKGIQSKDFADIPPDMLGDYACEDVTANRKLYEFLKSHCDEGIRGVWETEILLTPVLFDMERVGMPVNSLELKIEKFKTLTKIIALSTELKELTGREINPRSSVQVYDLFVNQLGLPIVAYSMKKDKDTGRFVQGSATFDKNAMKKYLAHPDVLSDPRKKRIVQVLSAYREEAQYRSLFLEPYEELAVDGLLHPSYNQAVRTGRMACSQPNAQQLSKRAKKLIHPGPGEALLSFDYCLTGETEIITEYGNRTIKDIVEAMPPRLEDQKEGGMGVLSFDLEDGKIEFQRVVAGAKVGQAPIFKISLEDGSSIRATSDHKFLSFDDKEILVKDLVPGTRLAHLVSNDARYPAWTFENDKEKRKGYGLAHRVEGHASRQSYDGAMNPNYRGAGYAETCKTCGREFRVYYSQPTEAKFNGYCNKTCEEIRKIEKIECKKCGRIIKLGANATPVNHEGYCTQKCKGKVYRSYPTECKTCGKSFRVYPESVTARQAGYCSLECQGVRRQNHRVVSVEPDGFEDIYQITVAKNHNYFTANGLLNFQSQIEYRLICHYINDIDAIEAYARDPNTDFHQFVADQCGILRKQAKNLNFAMGYGAGKNKVLSMLATDPTLIAAVADKILSDGGSAEASARFNREVQALTLGIYNSYHERLPGLRATSNRATRVCKNRGFVFNAYGRRRHLPAALSYRAFNSIIQPCAADVMKERLVAIAPRYNQKIREAGIQIMINVHDETVFRGPIAACKDPEMQRYIKFILENTTVKFRVPIITGGGYSELDWNEASGDKNTTYEDSIGGPIEWETDAVSESAEEIGVGFE